MVVEDLKPASVYIFQVKQSLKKKNTNMNMKKYKYFKNGKITPISLKLEEVKEHCKDFSVYIWICYITGASQDVGGLRRVQPAF